MPDSRTEELALDGIVCHLEGERFDIGTIDEWSVNLIEGTRTEPSLSKPLPRGAVLGELDSYVNVGLGPGVAREL